MDDYKMISAVAAAQVFIERAEELIGTEGWRAGTKASGALRRASLELTRALADLRRPSC